jgi:hypothetical protein
MSSSSESGGGGTISVVVSIGILVAIVVGLLLYYYRCDLFKAGCDKCKWNIFWTAACPASPSPSPSPGSSPSTAPSTVASTYVGPVPLGRYTNSTYGSITILTSTTSGGNCSYTANGSSPVIGTYTYYSQTLFINSIPLFNGDALVLTDNMLSSDSGKTFTKTP